MKTLARQGGRLVTIRFVKHGPLGTTVRVVGAPRHVSEAYWRGPADTINSPIPNRGVLNANRDWEKLFNKGDA